MDRAKVIVHMYISIDGKIDGEYDGQDGDKVSSDFYDDQMYRLSNAGANGATTVKMYAAKGHPDLTKYSAADIDYNDWVPAIKSNLWDISFDRHGTAGWETNYFEYDGKKSRVIEVVTKQAAKEYLAFLRSMEIPYLICGDADLDIEMALTKLKQRFGIDTISLAGGAVINGAFLKTHMVDEISMVVAPYVSGDATSKAAFDTNKTFVNDRFKIKNVTQLDDGGLHLIFAKDRTN